MKLCGCIIWADIFNGTGSQFTDSVEVAGSRQDDMGQVENAEVWKPKYRNGSRNRGMKVRRKAAYRQYRCLVPY